jgi:hypothetical protein
MVTLALLCIPVAAAFSLCRLRTEERLQRHCFLQGLYRSSYREWLEQHGAKAKTAVAVRKHTIDAECGVRLMLQLACKEPVIPNRGEAPFHSNQRFRGLLSIYAANVDSPKVPFETTVVT